MTFDSFGSRLAIATPRRLDHKAAMNYVTLTYARAHFCELAARVEAGETVGITRHGKPVARLIPPEPRCKVTCALQQSEGIAN